MWLNPQKTTDLVTFTKEIFNGKLHFLCSVIITLDYFISDLWKVFPAFRQILIGQILITTQR